MVARLTKTELVTLQEGKHEIGAAISHILRPILRKWGGAGKADSSAPIGLSFLSECSRSILRKCEIDGFRYGPAVHRASKFVPRRPRDHYVVPQCSIDSNFNSVSIIPQAFRAFQDRDFSLFLSIRNILGSRFQVVTMHRHYKAEFLAQATRFLHTSSIVGR